jgi:outer membrane protein assembly factor BamD
MMHSKNGSLVQKREISLMEVRVNLQRAVWFGLVAASLIAALYACGGNKPRPNMTTEERFALALKMFKDKDYFDARTQFRIITLNAPGSSIVDQAQFYLAECHFHLDEFITAAAEYEKLLRLYPRSELLDDAQYRIGLCYDKLSPKADLDQKYTLKAIEEFQRFLEEFPDSEHAAEVYKKLSEARNKLAKKEFNTGNLYRKMDFCEAAIISFGEVLNFYYDTRYAEPALFYKAECLYKLQRYTQAREALEELLERFPQTSFQTQTKSLLNQISQLSSTDGADKK